MERQVNEVVVIQSMYDDEKGAFRFLHIDQPVFEKLQEVTEDELPNEWKGVSLDFKLCLPMEGQGELQIEVSLPQSYPDLKPTISATFPRADAKALRDAINAELSTAAEGEECLCDIIAWILEKAPEYEQTSSSVGKQKVTQADLTYSYCGFYMHHIYSEKKKKNIKAWCRELHLTGMHKFGKPGSVVIEGRKAEVGEFIYRIKNMNWKSIIIKEHEHIEIPMSKHEALTKQGEKGDLIMRLVGEQRHFDSFEGASDFSEYIACLRKVGWSDLCRTILSTELTEARGGPDSDEDDD